MPIVISYENKEVIAVPKLDNSTGKEQAQAVWKAILDWNLEEKVQILCYDTTASKQVIQMEPVRSLSKTVIEKVLFPVAAITYTSWC